MDTRPGGDEDALLREVLEAVCENHGISLSSDVEDGPARNYELALRLGIGKVFGIGDDGLTDDERHEHAGRFWRTAGSRQAHPEDRILVPLLGKRVRVTLARDPELVVEEGILLGYGEGGDIHLECDDGLVHHCWPRLCVEATGDEVSLSPPSKEGTAEAASGDLSDLAPWERDLLVQQAAEMEAGRQAQRANALLERLILSEYRSEHAGEHMGECSQLAVAELDARDGSYGCDTGCEYLQLQASLTCPHRVNPVVFTYGEFGDLAMLIEKLEKESPEVSEG